MADPTPQDIERYIAANLACEHVEVEGDGRRLAGEIVVSGAKNAALPELCAALLTAERVQLQNVPRLQDVATMTRLLTTMGVVAEPGGDGEATMALVADDVSSRAAPYEL